MNQYVTGSVIKKLRESKKLTQLELAQKLCVSDKTVSKWETGKGYPDISLLEPIAQVFGVSVTELLSGNSISNTNVSANMLKTKFYVCPMCGNVIHSTGEAVISCHGITLEPEDSEDPDDNHKIEVSVIEDEYYVEIKHDMTKTHYISFIAAVSSEGVQITKLYPEGGCYARFRMRGVNKICYYCNRDGLFCLNPRRH